MLPVKLTKLFKRCEGGQSGTDALSVGVSVGAKRADVASTE